MQITPSRRGNLTVVKVTSRSYLHILPPLPAQLLALMAAKLGVVQALGMNPGLGQDLPHVLLPTLLRMDSLAWPLKLMQKQSAK